MLEITEPNVPGLTRVGARQQFMMRKLLRIGSSILPYLAWVAPFVERAFWPKQDGLSANAVNDLKHHMNILYSSRQQEDLSDLAPVLEEQQHRLDRLEQQVTEMNSAIESLSRDQLDVADQVRALAGWVRNSAMAALFLLVLLLLLKGVQILHVIGH